MFVHAFRLASAFTRPVVISTRTARGDCRGVVAACTVVNRDGWVLTAAHGLDLLRRFEDEAGRFRAYRAEARDLEQATASFDKARKRKLRHIDIPPPDSARDCSAWWGTDGAVLRDVRLMPASDLALGRLEPFDPAGVAHYPAFKAPDADYAPGRSLCRLGFSFHEIAPAWDEARGAFVLPPEAFPIPLFPIEGMLTRFLSAPPPGTDAADGTAAPGKYIETSSPGLQGQSGGPVFDVGGAVWAIQSHTRHLPLGFRPRPRGNRKGRWRTSFSTWAWASTRNPSWRFSTRPASPTRARRAEPVREPSGAGAAEGRVEIVPPLVVKEAPPCRPSACRGRLHAAPSAVGEASGARG